MVIPVDAIKASETAEVTGFTGLPDAELTFDQEMLDVLEVYLQLM